MLLLNDNIIKADIFPDKTSQVWKIPNEFFMNGTPAKDRVVWKFESEAEFMHLAQLKTLLDLRKVYGTSTGTVLYLPYLPYARQDKMPSNEATFALTSFSILLNALEFDYVSIFDPHSDVGLYTIHNAKATWPANAVAELYTDLNVQFVCYPDAGAIDKYSKFIPMPFLSGSKKRDQLTGHIDKYYVYVPENVKSVLVVDDICDRGGTFILLAKELLAKGVEDMYLYVSHGLFTGGTQLLFDAGYKRIFTKDGEVFADSKQ